MSLQSLVLDANILIRAVLGNKVRDLLENFSKSVEFFISAIWTEDQDFFGTVIPVWTTDRIHIFFKTI